MLQLFVKLEVSIALPDPKYMQAVPKFKNSAAKPDHAPFGVFCQDNIIYQIWRF